MSRAWPVTDNHVYFSLYEALVDHGQQLISANPQEALKTINTHGKVMQLVMTQLVMWVNNEPAKVNHREGNKPPLVEDLIPSMSSRVQEYYDEEVARERALGLQKEVLTYIEAHAASFSEMTNKEYLNLMPDREMDPAVYCERFGAGPWRDILVKVHRYVGRGFKNACVVRFNTTTPFDVPGPPKSSLADSLQRVVLQHPKIAHDRTLSNPEAMEELRDMVEGTVQNWKAKRHEQAAKRHGQVASDGETNRGMLAEAVAMTGHAQQRSPSLPCLSTAGPRDRPASDLGRRLFPTEERTPAADRGSFIYPWNRVDVSSPERGHTSSGGPGNAEGVSAKRLAPHIPKVPSPLSQPPHRQNR